MLVRVCVWGREREIESVNFLLPSDLAVSAWRLLDSTCKTSSFLRQLGPKSLSLSLSLSLSQTHTHTHTDTHTPSSMSKSRVRKDFWHCLLRSIFHLATPHPSHPLPLVKIFCTNNVNIGLLSLKKYVIYNTVSPNLFCGSPDFDFSCLGLSKVPLPTACPFNSNAQAPKDVFHP